MRRRLVIAAGVVGGLVLAIQLVPYGRAHDNPPVVAEPPWSPATRALAARACFDCHSNQVRWPWYSHVAPLSWMVQRNVDHGRAELNFSEWGGESEIDEAADLIRSGDMPPRAYVLMHAEARLDGAERAALADALARLPGVRASGDHGDHGGDHDGD